jgi:aryl-alcohol dehydrogenase-like predicted oxidoreductase
MKKVSLADTGILVSNIGLGTVKFGRNQKVHYPTDFELPTDKAILDLLSKAQELGINLLDTAPAYGSSEERLGKLLQGQRDQWVLATKAGEEFIDGESRYDFKPETLRRSVERSLKRLYTDYLDIVLVHSNGEDKKIIEEDDVFTTLAELKKAGKIRAYGMSTKTVEGGLLAVEHSDVVMVMHNPIYTAEQEVIARAHQNEKAIFVKKAFASGHLEKISATDPIKEAMHFILQEPGVTSIILGTLNHAHLQYNVQCANEMLVG